MEFTQFERRAKPEFVLRAHQGRFV